jgi:hypothetical protein
VRLALPTRQRAIGERLKPLTGKGTVIRKRKEDIMYFPFAHYYSEEPVKTYPLTKGELRALAGNWAYEDLDCRVFSCLYGKVGSTDLWMWDYTLGRINKIAAILGQEEIEIVLAEADEKMRQRLGYEMWTAFREGRAILGDDAPAEAKCWRMEARND